MRLRIRVDSNLAALGSIQLPDDGRYLDFVYRYHPGGFEPREGRLILPSCAYFSDEGAETAAYIMLSDLGMAYPVIDQIEPYITNRVLDTAESPRFSASRILNFYLEFYASGPDPHDELQEAILDLVLRESAAQAPVRTVPAAKSSIETLKEVEVDTTIGTAQELCTICLEYFSAPCGDDKEMVVSKMPCSHLFHKHCIVKWLKSSHLCPLCRYAMPTS